MRAKGKSWSGTSTKSFAEQLNVPKMDDYGITPIEKFSGTTTYITLKNHHT